MENQNLKTVALVGRPNVGKSTLFNRLIGKRHAIETPVPGTTRDRLYGEVSWRGNTFNLVDLAGIEKGDQSEITRSIQASVDVAMETADLILFLVDWTDPENQIDRLVARKILKTKKDIILVVNKADNLQRLSDLEIFNRLGNFPNIIGVSAISGKNSGDLLDLIVEKLELAKREEKEKEKIDIRLAIIGRPNVGKSTLLNQIIGEERSVVSEEAGTTRDIVDVSINFKGKKIKIVDTAGIRRKGKIPRGSIEDYAVLRSFHALKESDIAILVIDAEEGLVAKDANILGQAKEWGKGLILAVNKIDLSSKEREIFMAENLAVLQEKLNFTPWLPVVFISAKEGENVEALLRQVLKVEESRQTEIDQMDLNEILEFAKGSNFQLQNITSIRQKKTKPPIFELKYKGKEMPHYTQIRFLENKIRDAYPMAGSPIFIDLEHRGKKG